MGNECIIESDKFEEIIQRLEKIERLIMAQVRFSIIAGILHEAEEEEEQIYSNG